MSVNQAVVLTMKNAVTNTLAISRAVPFPASVGVVGFLNMLPKANDRMRKLSTSATRMTTVFTALFEFPRLSDKRLPAEGASKTYFHDFLSIKGDSRNLGGFCLGNARIETSGVMNKKSRRAHVFPRRFQYSTVRGE
jgi:hypothetical protein